VTVPVGASSDVQMCGHGFRELAAIFVKIARACPNAHFSTKTVAKNCSSLFFAAFYVEILRIQRATCVPNVAEWHGLGWTTPSINDHFFGDHHP
jgi:hypothetical protein